MKLKSYKDKAGKPDFFAQDRTSVVNNQPTDLITTTTKNHAQILEMP